MSNLGEPIEKTANENVESEQSASIKLQEVTNQLKTAIGISMLIHYEGVSKRVY